MEISEGTGRKGGSPGGPGRPKAGIGAGVRHGGIGFAVSQQVARKQAVEPVGKGTTEDILVPIPAGANGNVTNAGPKSQVISWTLRNSCSTFWRYIMLF